MELQKTLLFFISLYVGGNLFSVGRQLKTKIFWKIQIVLIFILIWIFLVGVEIKILVKVFYFFPLTIGVLGFCFSFFLIEKEKLKKLNSILIFYDLLLVNLSFGRSLHVSIEHSGYILGLENKKKRNVCKNVVMQQLKSSSLLYFRNLHAELDKLSNIRIGILDLIRFNQENFKYELMLLEKKNVVLTQFYVQSLVVLCLWLICITYLIFTDQVFTHLKLILISSFLMCCGFLVSKKLLCKSEFQI